MRRLSCGRAADVIGRARSALALAVLVLSVAACGPAGISAGNGSAPSGTSSGPLRVVTTTSVFADIVRNVDREHADVISIIPAGVGPRTTSPRRATPRCSPTRTSSSPMASALTISSRICSSRPVARRPRARRRHPGDDRRWPAEPPLLARPDPGRPLLRAGHPGRADPDRPGADAAIYGPAEATWPGGRARRAAAASRRPSRGETASSSRSTTRSRTSRGTTASSSSGSILDNVGAEPTPAELAALVEKVQSAGVRAVFSEAQFNPELAQTLAQEAGITTRGDPVHRRPRSSPRGQLSRP